MIRRRTLACAVVALALAPALAGAAATEAKPAVKVAGPKETKDPVMEQLNAQVAKVDKKNAGWRTSLTKPEALKFDAAKKYYCRMVTNKGTIRIRFLPDVAPMHVSSFMYLTQLGFYDGIKFHRVIKGFMAQGGDPLGNGTGGPGYQFGGEFSPSVKHDKPGLLSMANAGPGTDGSQFFLTFVPTPWLDGKHTIFGEVVEGMDVLKSLEAAGTRAAPPPARPPPPPAPPRPHPSHTDPDMKEFAELRTALAEVYDLNMAASLLRWDQTTYMPPGGAEARGRQLALLGRLAHERFTDASIGRLIDTLEPWAASLPAGSDDAAIVRVTRREYERALRVPASFVAESEAHFSATYQSWTEARGANDFARMRPMLEKTLELSRRWAGFFPGREHPMDALIDYSDPGMKSSEIRTLFAALRERLVPLVKEITARPAADDACLRQFAPEADQWAFGLDVIRAYGYDFERGRQDKTHHPFMTKFSLGDVRITTRVRENDLTDALFSTLHESGHAMYEQGIAFVFEGTPLANGASSGVHESQSRLWENLVGRSRGFWEHFYPQLQRRFPKQLQAVPLDTFYRAINRVERSLIRTDADECTYNLHVMLRFDLELDLLDGKIAVKDLPEVWRERFRRDIGIAVPDDKDGVLQDVHWYAGPIGGAFQGYTLGNILSAQFFESAVAAHPAIPSEVARGSFGTLRGWLVENVYRHGAKYEPDDLVRRATGSGLTIEPYLRYLWGKFGPLYGLGSSEPASAAAR